MDHHELTLAERLDEGPLDVRDVVGIVDDVLDAIALVHATGLVYRTLAPELVVLAHHQDRLRARLAERPPRAMVKGAAEPSFGTTLGAFQCMAPEQVRGSSTVDGRADVYAVGAIAFTALTGRFPFEGVNALTLIAMKMEGLLPTLESVGGRSFAPLLELFVATAMAADRARRYPRIEVARSAWREATLELRS